MNIRTTSRRMTGIVSICCILFLIQNAAADYTYFNPYNLEYITIAFVVDDTWGCQYDDTTIEYKIGYHLANLNAIVSCLPNTTSAITLALYNVTLEIDPLLGSTKIDDIISFGGNVLLLDDAVMDMNGTSGLNITQASYSRIKILNNGTNTRGYPTNVTLDVGGTHKIVDAGTFTVVANETDNNTVVIATKDTTGSIALMGFVPTDSTEPFHIWRIIEKTIFWQTGIWSRLTVVNASSDALIVSDPRHPYTTYFSNQEKTVYEWLEPEIGTALTVVPLSEVTIRGMSLTQRVIITDYEKVTTMLPSWRSQGKDILLLHAGAKDLEYLFGGEVNSTDDPGNYKNLCDEDNEWDDKIVSNRQGEITYGYPVDIRIDISTGTRYLIDISYENLTMLVVNGSGEGVIAYYTPDGSTNANDSVSEIMALGFDLSSLKYHGNLFLNRSYDWLTGTLNITGETAGRIVIPVYGGGEGPTSQEDALYDRLSSNYDVTKINISATNITDYSATELVIVHDYGRVNSLLDTWNTSGIKLFFVYEGVREAQYFIGYTWYYGAYLIEGCNKYNYINKSDEGEITYGYVTGASVPAQDRCGYMFNITELVTLVQGRAGCAQAGAGGIDILLPVFGNILAYGNNSDHSYKTVVYGFNPYEAGYHDWKLLDRSVEWLFGTLNVTKEFYDEYCYVTNSTSTYPCQQGRVGKVDLIVFNNNSFSSEESHYKDILDSLTVTDGISYSTVEIAYTTVANYTNTSAAIVPVPGWTDAYYYTNFLNGSIGVLLPRVGAYDFITDYGGGVPLTSNNWGGTGIIYTNNSNHSFPTFGYPNSAKVQVCSSCGSGNTIGFTWASLPANFVGTAGADPVELGGSPADRKYTLITNNATFNAPLVLMTFVPNTHHGDILFGRSLMWLLGELDVSGVKTKDIVFIVYNEDSLTGGEQAIEDWLNSSFSINRYSTLDISKVMASELWGTSRYVAYKKDLIPGVVNYWHNLSNGIIFLGESVYDAADALDVAAIGAVEDLDVSYTGAVDGTVVNNHTILGSAENNSVVELATAYTDLYAVAGLNTSLFTELVKHTDCFGTCEEILLAAHQSVGNMTIFGINPLYATNTSRDWATNAINWVFETDTVPPTINSITISPENFSSSSAINILVNVTDDRCIAGNCVGVYNVTLNYTTNLSDGSGWTILTLTRWSNQTDFWEGDFGPFNGKTYVVYQVIAMDTTGNVNNSVFYYYGVLESIPPIVTNVRYQPYMPTSLNDIIVNWTTDEFSNSTIYWRTNGTIPWTPISDSTFSLEHSINVGKHPNGIYEYWIMACDFLNNCVNETNYGDYFLFCVEPGCERQAPSILSVEPSNGTIFPGSMTSLLLNITTDEWAQCRYSNVSNTTFYNMSDVFTYTYRTNHTSLVELKNNTNDFYIRCKDMFGTNSTDDYFVYFFMDVDPPNVALNLPLNDSMNNGSTVIFNYSVSDNMGINRCSLYLNYTLWEINRTSYYVTNGTSNTFTVSLDDFSFPWNVRCWDVVNNSAFALNNFTVTINTTAPTLVFGSEECSETAPDGDLCYPMSLAVGSVGIVLQDSFETANITDWEIVTYGSGVVETRETYKHSGDSSLFLRTTVTSTDLAYLKRNITLEYPYIVDYWVYVPSGQSINGTGGMYITQTDNLENAEIALQLLDDDYALDVNDNGIWVYDVANITPNTWTNVKVSMINTTHWKLFVNDILVGLYREKSSAAPNVIVFGEFKNDSGLGTSYYDDVYVLNGRIVVLDTDNHRVQVFTLDGTFESKFGSFGNSSIDGAFYYPEGIAVSDTGYIYVADSINDRVQVFWPNGTFKFKVAGLNDPGDVAVTDLLIYVTDTDNNRIRVFNLSGEANATMGFNEVNRPKGITVKDRIYVADTGNNSISVFNLNGSLEMIIERNFSQPNDIAINNGLIHVIDTGNNMVEILRPNGTHYKSFGGFHSSSPGKFDTPKGIAANGDYIYVADTENSRVQVFSIYYGMALPYLLPTPMIANMTLTGFNNASGVFVNNQGDIYVADKLNNRVRVFNSQGTLIRTISGLNRPSDVSVDGAGKVYVADTNNYMVNVFWPNGAQYGNITGLSQLQGVAVWYRGEVYVADTNNHSISVYHPNWSLNYMFGGYGSSSAQFNTPMDLTVDKNGRIYIADRLNNRIQVLNADGTYNMTIGNLTAGNDSGQFDNPHSVAVDHSGMTYVADTNNDRVQIFDSDGAFNFSFTANGTLDKPEGIAVGHDGKIYIANTGDNTVLVFNGYPITSIIPPQISNPQPANNTIFWPFTSSFTMNVSTQDIARCRYSNTSGTSFDSMTNVFEWTNSIFHSETITGLSNNNSYDYYIKCGNPWGLNTTEDYYLQYRVSYPQVVINEFMPNPVDVEWIEFYNKGETSVNLDNWTLSYNDSFGSSNYSLDGVINRFGFSIFYGNDTGIALNDTTGNIWLLDSNNSVVDNVTYNATLFNASWSFIPVNVSIGRMPDGFDNWTSFVNSTKGSSNAGTTQIEISLTLGWNLISVSLQL